MATLAMLIIGTLAGLLVFHAVPAENKELVTFALGALSGALTVGGVHRFTNTTTKPPAADPPQ